MPPLRTSQPRRPPRIGYLGLTPTPNEAGFRQGLGELGYVEGENTVIEWRWADGREDRLPQILGELLQLDLDVLVTRGTVETLAAMHATATLPVVFTSVTD